MNQKELKHLLELLTRLYIETEKVNIGSINDCLSATIAFIETKIETTPETDGD